MRKMSAIKATVIGKIGALLIGSAPVLFAPTPTPPKVPHGVFNLVGVGGNINRATLTNPSVDGISLRQSWADLEPSEGVFNWAYFDSQIARARAAGKSVLLRVGTGGTNVAKGGNKAQWLFDSITAAGGTFVVVNDGGKNKSIPVFWDATLIAKTKDMIDALGARYTGNPAVKIVNVAVVNANTNDWSCPDASADIINWQAAGYTSQKVIDAGCPASSSAKKGLIDKMMAAFPNQIVCMSIGRNSLKLDPLGKGYVATTMVNNARAKYPGRLVVEMNNLSAKVEPAPGTGTLYQLIWHLRPCGWQMLWSTFGDPTFRDNGGIPADPATVLTESVNIGVGYEGNYIEIYEKDAINLPAVIDYAHSVL